MPSPVFQSILVAAGCTIGTLSYEASALAQTQTFSTVIEFQASNDCPYTVPSSINRSGVVTGYCSTGEPGAPLNGFIRDALGNVTIFSPDGSKGTRPVAINSQGFITGIYSSATGGHGFVRAPDGTITRFALPGGGSVPPSGLLFYGRITSGVSGGINAQGAMTGTYRDKNNDSRGFLRLPDGRLTVIDLGAGNTYAVAINDLGEVTGSYQHDGKSAGYVGVQ